MKTTPLRAEDLRGVFAVPPLARRADKRRALDLEANGRILRHMAAGRSPIPLITKRRSTRSSKAVR